jgi:hypothetical protein
MSTGSSGGPPAGSGSSSIDASRPPGLERASRDAVAGRGRAADAAQQERGEDGVRPGSPGLGGTTHGSATWRCARRRWASSRSRARSSAAPSGSVAELALVGDQRREEADARGRLPRSARERLAVEPAGDDVELGLPGRVVQRAAPNRRGA